MIFQKGHKINLGKHPIRKKKDTMSYINDTIEGVEDGIILHD